MHQIVFFSAGASPPDPTGGAYSAPLDRLAVFRRPTSKGRGEEKRGGREFVVCPRKKKEKSAPMHTASKAQMQKKLL